jgi:hypothetical protein
VTGERIRDKIAASKRKGIWMGGVPPTWLRHCRQSPFASSSTSAAVMSSRARTASGRGVGRSRPSPAPRGGRRPAIRPLDRLAVPTGPAPSCAPSRSSPDLQRGRSHLPGCGRTIPAVCLIDRSRLHSRACAGRSARRGSCGRASPSQRSIPQWSRRHDRAQAALWHGPASSRRVAQMGVQGDTRLTISQAAVGPRRCPCRYSGRPECAHSGHSMSGRSWLNREKADIG